MISYQFFCDRAVFVGIRIWGGHQQYIREVFLVYQGMFNTSEGYHDSCGGYHKCTRDVQYIGGFQINQSLSSISFLTWIMVSLWYTHGIPAMSWTSSYVLMISPNMNYDILNISQCTQLSPNVLKTSWCTEHPLMYWTENWVNIQGVNVLSVVLNFMNFIFTYKYYVKQFFLEIERLN